MIEPGKLPLLRAKVASVGEPDEGPARERRNKDSFGRAIGPTLTRLAGARHPRRRDRGVQSVYFAST